LMLVILGCGDLSLVKRNCQVLLQAFRPRHVQEFQAESMRKEILLCLAIARSE